MRLGRGFAGYLGHPAKYLLCNGFTRLESLSIDEGQIAEEDLVAAMSACSSTLISLHLKQVDLLEIHQPWPQVIQLLASMPKLRSPCLAYLEEAKVWCYSGRGFEKTLILGHAETRVSRSHEHNID